MSVKSITLIAVIIKYIFNCWIYDIAKRYSKNNTDIILRHKIFAFSLVVPLCVFHAIMSKQFVFLFIINYAFRHTIFNKV